jgi:hypothetical protein
MSLNPGDYRYAVAIRDSAGLWLTLWVRRKLNGEFFVIQPRSAQRLKFSGKAWNPHTSYHLDGSLHQKSYDNKVLPRTRHQPLTGTFQGTEHLGIFAGHGTGIVCDPTAFTGVIEVVAGILGPHKGMVSVDLVQPGFEPIAPLSWAKLIQRHVFRDFQPWVVIRVWQSEGELVDLYQARQVCAYFHWIDRGRPLWEADVDWEWAAHEIPD